MLSKSLRTITTGVCYSLALKGLKMQLHPLIKYSLYLRKCSTKFIRKATKNSACYILLHPQPMALHQLIQNSSFLIQLIKSSVIILKWKLNKESLKEIQKCLSTKRLNKLTLLENLQSWKRLSEKILQNSRLIVISVWQKKYCSVSTKSKSEIWVRLTWH